MFVSVSSRLLGFIAVASRQCPRSLAQRILSALTFRIVRISYINHGGQCIRVCAGGSGSTSWLGSLRVPSAYRVVICELMSSERAQWLFCSSLQKEVAGIAAWTCPCVCARSEFQHRQSAQNSASHERAGSCSRHGAVKTCQRGSKGPGRSRSKMCARQKPEMWDVCHESRSLVHMIVGT